VRKLTDNAARVSRTVLLCGHAEDRVPDASDADRRRRGVVLLGTEDQTASDD
jgi:hypothetical protein